MSIIDSEQNWQSYRTLINGNISYCTVNLDIVERFSPDSYNKIIQVSMPYESDEKSMPTLEEHERITLDLFRLLVQSSSLSEVIYAGHISGDGHLQVYYYCDDSEPLFDMLSQFKDCVDKIDVPRPKPNGQLAYCKRSVKRWLIQSRPNCWQSVPQFYRHCLIEMCVTRWQVVVIVLEVNRVSYVVIEWSRGWACS